MDYNSYQALDDFQALTLEELEHLLDARVCGLQSIRDEINGLVSQNRIQYVKIQRNNPLSKYKFFKEYVGKRLYYIDNKHLMNWIIMQVPPPDKTSEKFQKALKRKAKKNFGIII